VQSEHVRRPICLLQAIRIVIRADSDPVRQALFANLRESHASVRLVCALHERLRNTAVAAVLVTGYGVATFLAIAVREQGDARFLCVARHANARRQVSRVVAWLDAGQCAHVDVSIASVPLRAAQRARAPRDSWRSLVRALRMVRRIDRRHSFLVTCRVASALAWYARGKAILRAHTAEAIIVSSDTNPEEVGFTAAARALGVPTIFISHAYPTPFAPPLAFDLSILGGQAEVDARRRRGPIAGDILLAGLEGESKPLDAWQLDRPEPAIGIFAPKAVSWTTLARVIEDCRTHFRARRIVIRWHPSMIEPPRLSNRIGDLSGIVESPAGAPLADVARQCDWVVADENSSVHLPVLKLGIPSIAVKNLGRYPETRTDMYGFVQDGVIPPAVPSIRDVRSDVLASFFSNGWSARFQQYDASYARPQVAIQTDVRAAIQRLRLREEVEAIGA
jgi:hypothetical protein